MIVGFVLGAVWFLVLLLLVRLFAGRRTGERLAEAEWAEHCRTAGVVEPLFTCDEVQALRLLAAQDAAGARHPSTGAR